MKEIKQLKERGKPDAVKGTDGLVAAMRIQKVWRGFTTRRKTRHGKVEEMYLIGMIPRPERQNEALIENEKKVLGDAEVIPFDTKWTRFNNKFCSVAFGVAMRTTLWHSRRVPKKLFECCSRGKRRYFK